jgi:hypothetical protein
MSATNEIKQAILSLRKSSTALAIALEALAMDSDDYAAIDRLYGQNQAAITELESIVKPQADNGWSGWNDDDNALKNRESGAKSFR